MEICDAWFIILGPWAIDQHGLSADKNWSFGDLNRRDHFQLRKVNKREPQNWPLTCWSAPHLKPSGCIWDVWTMTACKHFTRNIETCSHRPSFNIPSLCSIGWDSQHKRVYLNRLCPSSPEFPGNCREMRHFTNASHESVSQCLPQAVEVELARLHDRALPPCPDVIWVRVSGLPRLPWSVTVKFWLLL